jgi:Uma2 family endonuclease
MAQAHLQPLTFGLFEDFLAWESRQDSKHELIDGVPVGMAGAKEGHTIIQGNLFAYAFAKLRGTPCRALPSDMAVKTGVRSGRYPDMTIDCGRPNPDNQAAPKPVVVFEVLSPETQREDRTVKLADYNGVESIAHYVLVEPSEPLVHIYSRAANGEFSIKPEEVRGMEGSFALPAVGVTFTMAEVYEAIAFNPGVQAPATASPWRQ